MTFPIDAKSPFARGEHRPEIELGIAIPAAVLARADRVIE